MKARFRETLARGVALFNRQEFYAAYTAWESGWADVAEERVLLQGLIQVAAGFYKLQVGEPRGAMALLEQGARKLRGHVVNALGMDLAALLPEVEAWRAEAQRLMNEERASFDPGRFPKLTYTSPVTH
jgi:predicted metal-dependent hydrolase